ncbi:MAG TPA: hypothetical protein VFN96_05950, partial [Gemmatimonadales bacterium]|nr:hypothetical protein [Gemmatimonadales bacterium]
MPAMLVGRSPGPGGPPRKTPPAPTVAAVVAPAERASLDAASVGCFAVIHRNSIPEALTAVRERPIDAVVLSVQHCAAERD